jgi:hypothetical protein
MLQRGQYLSRCKQEVCFNNINTGKEWVINGEYQCVLFWWGYIAVNKKKRGNLTPRAWDIRTQVRKGDINIIGRAWRAVSFTTLDPGPSFNYIIIWPPMELILRRLYSLDWYIRQIALYSRCIKWRYYAPCVFLQTVSYMCLYMCLCL